MQLINVIANEFLNGNISKKFIFNYLKYFHEYLNKRT